MSIVPQNNNECEPRDKKSRCGAYPGELGVDEKLLRTSDVMGHLAFKNNERVFGRDIDKVLLN